MLADARGRLVRDSGEPGELAYETGQRLRGAKGATWLERFASLKAGAVCAWIEGRNRVWSILSQSQVISKDTIFLGERVCEVSVIHYLEEMWACGADS